MAWISSLLFVVLTCLSVNGSKTVSSSKSLSQDSPSEVHLVSYQLRNLSLTSIFLTFSIKTKHYQLILAKVRDPSNVKVYVMDKINQPRLDSQQMQGLEYHGHNNYSSYSIFLHNGIVSSGVLVTDVNYLVFYTEGSRLRVEKHWVPIIQSKPVRNLQFPHEGSRKSKSRTKRNVRIGQPVHKAVKFSIFTEYLLYKKYCEKHSPQDADCQLGRSTLSKYVTTIATGAKLYYDRIANPDLKLLLNLTYVIHNARTLDPETKEEKSLYDQLDYTDKNGNPTIDSKAALEKFATYQQNFFIIHNDTFEAQDQVTLLTMHELADERSTGLTTIGIAYVQGICDINYKAAVCQYKPRDYGWNTVYILAHEMGHNLGANHDGRYKECPATANNIMSSHNLKDNLQNLFYFSCCSLREMIDTIEEFGSCLKNWDEVIPTEDMNMPGVRYDRTDQCMAEFGGNYLPCHKAGFVPQEGSPSEYMASFQEYVNERKDHLGTDECLTHWCYNPAKGECEISRKNPVLAGTWCDEGKWCIEGECIIRGNIEAGPHKPTCDISSQTLTHETADLNEKITVSPPVTYKLYGVGDLVGRSSGIIVGCAFFVVGILSSILRGKKQLARKERTLHQMNTSTNNSDLFATIPQQYH